jgi:hypothetical protein|tara:strand:+ start:5039 stop:6484 length:1446 start_codon:yes stop_codon:yes gene_type:complete
MATVNLGNAVQIKPSAVQIATSENYVSNLTTNSLRQRDVSENLVKRYGEQGITGLMELMGSKAPTSNTTFEHYEEAFRHNSVSAVFGTTSANNSAEITLTIQSDSFQANFAGTTNEYSPVRPGDILRDKDGDMFYVISTQFPSASTYTVKVHSIDGANVAKTSDPFEFAIIGNAHPEGGSQPDSLSPLIHEYSNKCMILKESFEVTGSEATNVVYVKVDNEKMGSGYVWYLKGESDTFKRFMDYSEIMMMLGEDITNATLEGTTTAFQSGNNVADNSTLRGTLGLLPWIETDGQSMDLGAASINMADFDAIIKSLDKYRGAKEYALYAGIDLSLDIDDLLAAQGAYAAGGANYGTFQNNRNMALNLGFNSFTRGGYTFHKKTYDLFNHPRLLGATGFHYGGYGVCIPMDMQKDARSGDQIPSLRIRYKAANGYSRDMEHWLTGSAVLQNKTNTTDVLQSHYRCERGFEGYAANRYMLIKKS